MGKTKAEAGTPKWLANKMKSKGLQKLRWYCQMCQKQCRDQNGFKCHTMSESHQRQLLLFADQPNKFLGEFSREFEGGFLNLLKRAHNTKRVFANMVYQEYIREKDHVHMNATRWESLSGFVQYLGRTGKCTVDRTEKGWYIAWIDRDPETIARQEALAKKDKMAKDDEERLAEFITKQVEKGKTGNDTEEAKEYKELVRESEDSKIALNINLKAKAEEKIISKPVIKINTQPSSNQSRKKETIRKKSALEEIMEAETAKKRQKTEQEKLNIITNDKTKHADVVERPWLRKNIVVKIVTKSLGDKYYKQKGVIKEVVGDDKMGAVVILNSNGCKLKLDQSHLETVVPAVGRTVLILNGKFKGEKATLKELDVDNFSARLKLDSGEKVMLPYENFSKLSSN